MADANEPVLISRYRILGRIGAGGMGVVYEAEDVRLGRRVAVKFLAPDLARDRHVIARLQREARAASGLNHPNICTIFDIDEHEGEPFIVMELLEGQTLTTVIDGKPLDPPVVVDIARQLTEGLNAAHRQGIIHRDLKPANVFVTTGGTVKILDFGLAKLIPVAPLLAQAHEFSTQSSPAETPLSGPAAVLGTPAYMSPEQLRGEPLDARSDLFSLGAVLYEMATGERAFTGHSIPVLLRSILDHDPRPPSTVNPRMPAGLEPVIRKLLRKNPADRYQSAAELAVDLAALDARASGYRRQRARPLVTAIALLAIAAAVLFGLLWAKARRPAHPENVIVVGPIENRTGDPVFDGTLQRALAIALEQSPFVKALSPARIRETVTMMKRRAEERMPADAWREMCVRAGATALVDGSIAAIEPAYVIAVQAVDCATGDLIATEQAQANGRGDVLGALGRAGLDLRRRLGEPPRLLEAYNRPLQQATTGSLDALRAYSIAHDLIERGQDSEAIPLLERSLAIDPSFALAHARLATAQRNAKLFRAATDHARQAYELRSRVTDRERLYIEQAYHSEVTGDITQLENTLKVFKYTYPRDPVPRINLAVVYAMVGNWELAVQEARGALQVDPAERLAFENLAEYLIRLKRFDEARQVVEDERRRGYDTGVMHERLFTIHALGGNPSAAASEMEWLKWRDSDRARRVSQEHALYTGRVSEALALLDQRVQKLMLDGREETAAIAMASAASQIVAVDKAAAERLCRRALDTSGTPRVIEATTLPLALADARDAAQYFQKARAEVAGDLKSIWIPIDEAAVALSRRNAAEALRLLGTVATYEFGESARAFPAYLRTLAYLQMNDGASAMAQAERIAARDTIDPFSPMPIVAHALQGRAAALQGDEERSRARYGRFLDLWKHADPALPLVLEAQRELGRHP